MKQVKVNGEERGSTDRCVGRVLLNITLDDVVVQIGDVKLVSERRHGTHSRTGPIARLELMIVYAARGHMR